MFFLFITITILKDLKSLYAAINVFNRSLAKIRERDKIKEYEIRKDKRIFKHKVSKNNGSKAVNVRENGRDFAKRI